jgi:hypothetical protein
VYKIKRDSAQNSLGSTRVSVSTVPLVDARGFAQKVKRRSSERVRQENLSPKMVPFETELFVRHHHGRRYQQSEHAERQSDH